MSRPCAPTWPLLRTRFAGTVQIQGGITTLTIGDAVRLGADFVVCGSELFRSPAGLAPAEVVAALLTAAADVLAPGLTLLPPAPTLALPRSQPALAGEGDSPSRTCNFPSRSACIPVQRTHIRRGPLR